MAVKATPTSRHAPTPKQTISIFPLLRHKTSVLIRAQRLASHGQSAAAPGRAAIHPSTKVWVAGTTEAPPELRPIVDLAERYGCSIRTTLRLDIAPENAILRQARVGGYNLIVLGVARPAGESLFFGKVAAAIVDNSECSVLFLST